MRKLLVPICVAALGVLAYLHFPPPPQGDDEEYAVYSAIIQDRFVRDGIQAILIEDQTRNYTWNRQGRAFRDEISEIKEGFEPWGIRADTVASYMAQNRAQRRLEDRFDLPFRVFLLSAEDFNGILSRRGPEEAWQTLYQKYPHSLGVLTFSRVGFNALRDQAFVYGQIVCGDLCGGGDYYFLVRTGRGWKVEMARQIWIS
jgi:hypothetical protein